jgi:cyclic pyranopterin phosphate synthase
MNRSLRQLPILPLPMEQRTAPPNSGNHSTSAKTNYPYDALVDSLGRIHSSLRLSVIDRCNLRCQYCMPAEDVTFLPSQQWLPFPMVARLVQILARCGVHKVRLTGGEPLMRPGLADLVRRLNQIEPSLEIALTTNGMLLADQVEGLRQAGLDRLNISLDTLSESTFQRLTRRPGLPRVLQGIDAAINCGIPSKLNALILRGINDQEIIPLVEFAASRQLAIRFIEFMPLDADRAWTQQSVVQGEEIRQTIERHFGSLQPVDRVDPSQPAEDYRLPGGTEIGWIDSVSKPFCAACNRLRLTAEGRMRNCLFGREEWDLSELLRSQADEEQILQVVRDCVAAKHPSHGIDRKDFQPPPRAMYQIGG